MLISHDSFSRRLSELYNNIITSNAFYPTLISVVYVLLVIGLLNFDHSSTAQALQKEYALLHFKEASTAQSILSTLTTGMISLIALSFSMVMVVLSQASNSTSPKVTQGLITRKSHQFVLGNQVGAIIYCLVLLLFLRAREVAIIPSFSILISVVLGIWSIGLFVFFIHSISNAIQVPNIIRDIHITTQKALRRLPREADGKTAPDVTQLSNLQHAYITDQPGFLQEVQAKRIVKVASRYNAVIRMHGYLTDYIVTGQPLFHASISSTDLPEKAKKIIYNSIVFYPTENVHRNYEYGFTQLSEVAVKALSPGVNDPGIACLCIQYLADLFVVLYDINEKRVFTDEEGTVRLVVNKITFKDLFNLCVTPIRQYGVKDISVARGLLGLMAVLGSRDAVEQRHQQVLNQQAAAVLAGIEDKLTGETDKDAINSMIEKMRRVDHGYFCIQTV
ncbi:MAG: DUF2254 domain-containing protein [Cytophagales bacterium]|nr:DUF2254 domain-containing protein [Cytophagales bacterium]